MTDRTISLAAVLKLLSTIPSEEFATKAMLIEGVKALPPAQPTGTNTVQVDDCISRQAAIKTIQECADAAHSNYEWDREEGYLNSVDCIKALPPSQPSVSKTEIVGDAISRKAALDALADAMPSLTTPDGCGQFDHDIQVTDEAYVDCMRIIHDLPSAQPGQRNVRVFQGIIVEYPTNSTYPEYEGKPYFSIKYTENGQEFIGYGTYQPETLSEYLKEYFMPPAQPGWIPCTPETMPDNEHDVLVTVEIRPVGRKPFRRVVRAFYTDGKHTDADSAYTWYELEEPDFDDDGNIIVPEGWWEAVDYSEEFNMIDDFVVAWCEPLKPWEGEEHGTPRSV